MAPGGLVSVGAPGDPRRAWIRDLLILDCNGEVRRLIREGYQPVPQDAAMFLLEFEELEPFPPGWGREGLFLVAEGDAATIALDATADDALESYLEAGYRLATFDELGGVLPAHKTPPTTLIRSWVHARLAALTPPPKQEP